MFFSFANLADASLEITEIMYSPESGADYEWVEIYNNGTTSIDLTKYRFFHGETNSGPLTLKNGENTILSPSNYAIIAKSFTDYSWIDFSGMIFSSSILSLPDSGDNTYIAISDPDKNIIDYILYDISLGGSKISKSSLSKINSEWQSGVPTPGKTNKSVNNTNQNNTEQEEIANTNYSNPVNKNSETTKKETEILKITTKILSPKIVVAGIPFSFSSLTTTNRGNTYAVGRFVWNFGDGRVSEVKVPGPFEYTYEYPGEYSMTLSYFDNNFTKQPDATNRIIIKVIPAEIFINSVGDNINPFIELENKSNYEITLSNWIITAGSHYFVIPEGTTLLPGKKIKLSPKITGFTGDDIKSVSIMNTNKELIATYPVEIKIPIQKNLPLSKTTNNKTNNYNNKNEDSLLKDSNIINLNELAASAAGPNVDVSKSTYAFIGLVLIIGIGIASFLLIKRKEKISDYMENDIRPEDMTIIE